MPPEPPARRATCTWSAPDRVAALPIGRGSTSPVTGSAAPFAEPSAFVAELRKFAAFGARSHESELAVGDLLVPTFTNEFWCRSGSWGNGTV